MPLFHAVIIDVEYFDVDLFAQAMRDDGFLIFPHVLGLSMLTRVVSCPRVLISKPLALC